MADPGIVRIPSKDLLARARGAIAITVSEAREV